MGLPGQLPPFARDARDPRDARGQGQPARHAGLGAQTREVRPIVQVEDLPPQQSVYGQPARQMPSVVPQYADHSRHIRGRHTVQTAVITPGSGNNSRNRTQEVGRTVIYGENVVPGTEKGRRK